ncbi:MAG: flagellar basal-body rod protein FlgG [Gammaproteobacteria bacterium]|jgi:flagellar basal-body rod protein FlgG|nr:flagellar basal-body rod protein FlgG [Gammaproteobacteria bacterium]NNJ96638.1 flagellar basal-body rod protein FlgG [Gammaproteobacteria bacterium]
MGTALWIAKTGLEAQQTRMSTISNNLANASTIGFKRDRAVFSDLIYQNVVQVGAQSSEDTLNPSGLNLGTGVRTVATEKLFTQGNIIQTGNSLDIAIQGRGLLQVTLPDGTQAYTRDGTLQMDETGQLVTSMGYPIEPSITIPDNTLSITISSDGVVSVLEPGSAAPSEVGNVQLADFINLTGLQPIGNNLFLESAASGSPQTGTPGLDGLGTVVQSSLEASNVNTVEELVNMIEAQRAYEMNSKAISTVDQMLQYATNNL